MSVIIVLIVSALVAMIGAILALVGMRDNNRLKVYGALFGLLDGVFIFEAWPQGLGQLALVGGIIGALAGFFLWYLWPSGGEAVDMAGGVAKQGKDQVPTFTAPDDQSKGPPGSLYGPYGPDKPGL